MDIAADQLNTGANDLTPLQRIALGDATAVEDCINTHGVLIWGLAKEFTASREDAEAAACRIFLDIWKYAPRFDQTKLDEVNFIIMIARRHLIKAPHAPASLS